MMKKIILAVLLSVTLCGSAWGAVITRYAGPTELGTADGTTAANCYSIADFWAETPSAGSTLWLTDGEYKGADNMIYPNNATIDGTAGYPITVAALNEGKVVINCESAAGRRAVRLLGNDYFDIIGINAHNSVDPVVSFLDCENINFKRVIAWDGDTDDDGDYVFYSAWNTKLSSNILYEDCVAFGKGRKGFCVQSATNVILRRCFSRWEYNDVIGPKMAFSYSYAGGNATLENCIGTWDTSMGTVNQATAMFGLDTSQQPQAGSTIKLLGNIAYTLDSQGVTSGIYGFQMSGITEENLTWVVQDNIAYNSSASDIKGFYLAAHANNTLTIADNTVIGSTADTCGNKYCGFNVYNNDGDATDVLVLNCVRGVYDGDNFDYTATNGNANNTCQGTITHGVTSGVSLVALVESGNNIMRPDLVAGLSATGSAGDTIGAVINKRYENGTLTGNDLWPWPMNQRIIDAMTYAGKTPIDITDTIFTLGGGTNPYDVGIPESDTFYVMEGGTSTWYETTGCGAATAMDITTHNDDSDFKDYLDGTKAITIVLCDDADIKTQITVPSSGTSGKEITYTAESASTLIDLDGAAGTWGIYAENKDYINITGVTIQEAAYYGIRFIDDCDNIVIDGCTVTANGWGGIGFRGTGMSNITIKNCTVTDNDTNAVDGGNYPGILIQDLTTVSTGNVVTGNTVSGNTLAGIGFNQANGTISNNNVTNNQEIAAYGGIDLRGTAANPVSASVSYNYIHDVTDADNTYPGIYVTYPSGTAIYGNIIAGIDGDGAGNGDGILIDNADAGANVIYNNTLWDMEGDGIVVTNSNGSGSVTIKNNIISEADNYGLYVDSASCADVDFDYNDNFNYGANKFAYWGEDVADEAKINLADFKSETSECATQCYESDPKLNNEAAGDFTITDNSGNCDEGGATLGAPYNYAFDPCDIIWPFYLVNQDVYMPNWEIGAYVYIGYSYATPGIKDKLREIFNKFGFNF